MDADDHSTTTAHARAATPSWENSTSQSAPPAGLDGERRAGGRGMLFTVADSAADAAPPSAARARMRRMVLCMVFSTMLPN